MARVLIVDDDPVQRLLFEMLVKRAGHEATTVEGGEKALDLLARGEPIDVILTDLNMPGLTGDDLIQRLNSHYPQIPVVVMSVRSRGDFPARTYLRKPFNGAQLAEAIQTAFANQA